MNVLVTGGDGYIGHTCIRCLFDQGHKAYSLDNMSGENSTIHYGYNSYTADISDYTFLKHIIQSNKIDAIIHCAAFASVSDAESNPALYYENNTGKTSLLVRTAVDCGIKRFVFASSCAVYGNAVGRLSPIMPRNPSGIYGHSKAQSEEQLEWVAHRMDIGVTIARIFNVAGTVLHHGEKAKNRIIPLLVQSALKGNKVTIYGDNLCTDDGTAERDYIHVQDVANELCACVEHSGLETINICSGRTVSINQLIKIVSEMTGTAPNVEYKRRRAGEAESVCGIPHTDECISISRIIKSEINWQRGK